MTDVLTRTVKGSPLTRADLDKNFESLRRVLITAERSSFPAAGSLMSFGNGGSGQGVAVPYSGKVVAMTLAINGLANGETAVAQLAKNGTGLGTGYQISLTGDGSACKAGVLTFAAPAAIAAGDRLNVISITAPATTTTAVVGSALTELNY